MAYGLTFRLELDDGTPADPPTFRSAPGVSWKAGDTIDIGRRTLGCWASATTTWISRPHWSLRTCPDRPLAPLAEVSWFREGSGRGKRPRRSARHPGAIARLTGRERVGGGQRRRTDHPAR